MRIAQSLSVLRLAVLVAACVYSASAVSGDSEDANIMLDPDTGDISLVSPAHPRDDSDAAASANQKTGNNGDPKAKQTHHGKQMTASEASSGADERVVHCPDGSLRMGTAGQSDGDSGETPDKQLCDAR